MSVYGFDTAEYRLRDIRTGSAWEWQFSLVLRDGTSGEDTPLDLTGAEARMQIRRRVTDTVALVSLTQTSGITLTDNTLRVAVSSAQTALLQPAPCDVVWDLQLRLPGGDWWTPLKGTVHVVQGVSR